RRQLLGIPIERFGRDAIAATRAPDGWTIELGRDLLFDRQGLGLLSRAVASYRGAAARLELALVPDSDARRDLYSLQPDFDGHAARPAQKIGLAANRIARGAEIHPSAIVEGSVIGAGARIGALCVVRYSVIGESARLHDGAKVEYSVVGKGSWLMHDLVLSRS